MTVSRRRVAAAGNYGSIGVEISLTVELEPGDDREAVVDNLYRWLTNKENELLGLKD